MSDLGRPLLPSAISKIESGQRRVDVDELVALAVALDCTPNRLLISPEAGAEPITLTASGMDSPTSLGTIDVTPSARDGWRWARGVSPLDVGVYATDDTDEAEREADAAEVERTRRFQRENRPDDVPDQTDFSSLRVDQRAVLDALASAAVDQLVNARENGLRWNTIVRYLRLQTDQSIYTRALAKEKAQQEGGTEGD